MALLPSLQKHYIGWSFAALNVMSRSKPGFVTDVNCSTEITRTQLLEQPHIIWAVPSFLRSRGGLRDTSVGNRQQGGGCMSSSSVLQGCLNLHGGFHYCSNLYNDLRSDDACGGKEKKNTSALKIFLSSSLFSA